MVAPITGPFTRNWSNGWPVSFTAAGHQKDSLSRTWYRQKAPFDRPLTFSSDGSRGTWLFGSDRSPLARAPQGNYCWISTPTSSSSNAYNNAWSKFDEQLRGQAQWAVTLLQYRQANDALVKNLTDLYHIFRDIRRGRFGDLYRRFKPPPGFKMKGKSVADRILEWRFGWFPLWDDIHNSAASLGRDLGSFKATGKATATWTETSIFDNLGTYAGIREKRTAAYKQHYRLSADIRISNPNALLWDSLGLTNPLTVAYEMVPFSFVLNYFINLEEFLKGLSPYMGLELTNSCTTHFTTVNTSLAGTVLYSYFPYPNIGPYLVSCNGWMMRRTVGAISGAKLRVRDPWILQPGRGVNAISLLLQQLAKKH